MKWRHWLKIAVFVLPTFIVVGGWVYSAAVADGFWLLAWKPWLVLIEDGHLRIEIPTEKPVLRAWPETEIQQIAFPAAEIGVWHDFLFGSVQTATGVRQSASMMGIPVRVIRVSMFFLLLMTLPTLGVAYALWRRGTRAERLRMAGMCPSCGYDTRATPDRCPECGTILTD